MSNIDKMFGFLKKLFGKGEQAPVAGQTPPTGVPGAVDQVGTPPPTPVVPTATPSTAQTPPAGTA